MTRFSNTGFKKTKKHKYKKQKRRRTRRRYLRGGWGNSIKFPFVKSRSEEQENKSLGLNFAVKGVMKGGWGPAVAPMV